jgi:hypothetical protein
MRHGSTLFLKAVITLIGIAVLAFCILWLPGAASRDAAAHPETAYFQYPFLICSYILSVPFFVALYQALRLLSYIDGKKAFSELSVKALRYIKHCANTISTFIVLGVLFVIISVNDDITAIIMLGFIFTFASSVIATFAAVLQKVLQDAIALKSENELTV